MKAQRRVTLRSTADADGTRHLEARLTDTGDLVIAGQDLGAGVEQAFGSGMTEYEWAHTVRAGDIAVLVAALGGEPGADVLELLQRVCSGSDAARLAMLLAHDVPSEFWSRVGD